MEAGGENFENLQDYTVRIGWLLVFGPWMMEYSNPMWDEYLPMLVCLLHSHGKLLYYLTLYC